MAAWIKISLGMELGLGPGDFVSDGDPAPPPKLAHVYCGQTVGWITMVLGMVVGLSPGLFVLYWDPAPSPQGGGAPSPICDPFLLWPNSWKHQDATWY